MKLGKDSDNAKKKPGTKRIFIIAAAVCFMAAALCLVLPSVRKRDAISATGSEVMLAMRSAASAISYYSADEISSLAAKPALNSAYKHIAGLLAQLSTQFGYEKTYLIARAADGKALQYLVDGSYRDNGQNGVDYYAPAYEYPSDNGYKAVRQAADRMYSGKSTGEYVNSLITTPGHKSVVVSCLPVYGAGHTVAAVLCIEADPGDTAYHMAGTVNLYYAGLILILAGLLCVALLMIGKKLSLWREEKRLRKEHGLSDNTIGVIDPDSADSFDDPVEPPFGDDVDAPLDPPIDTAGAPYRSLDDSHLDRPFGTNGEDES